MYRPSGDTWRKAHKRAALASLNATLLYAMALQALSASEGEAWHVFFMIMSGCLLIQRLAKRGSVERQRFAAAAAAPMHQPRMGMAISAAVTSTWPEAIIYVENT